MVQQPMPAETFVESKKAGDNLPSGRSDPEPRPQLDETKTAAISNWLNSKICGKAC